MKNKKEIILDFSKEIANILGADLKKIILYGSYARGDYRENSDVDIMVLTSLTDVEIEMIENDIYNVAFEYEMKYFIDFSVVIKNEEQFNYWLGVLQFYENEKKEGILLNG